VLWLLVTTNVVPSSLILVTLMMEALHSSESSVLTRVARRNVLEDSILQRMTSFQCYEMTSVNSSTYCFVYVECHSNFDYLTVEKNETMSHVGT
jgi:hypothetical protein